MSCAATTLTAADNALLSAADADRVARIVTLSRMFTEVEPQRWARISDRELDTLEKAAADISDADPTALKFVQADTVHDEIPEWAWEFNHYGRVLKGGLTLFAGRPAAGKSTCARWFAASWTKGGLPGCWEGKPVNVAYVATEEAWSHTVVPSLKAAGADMQRVFFIQRDGEPARITASSEEAELTAGFLANEIRVVVLDPLMSTLGGGKLEINRSNEVREALDPWVRISEAIDGVVLGITHLTKAARDVTAGVNGSSAFGEVARCVFGFATDKEADDGTRVMTQSKNSSGIEGLNLTYRIGTQDVTVSDGRTASMARFELGDPTDRDVRAILADEQATGGQKTATADCTQWLRGYLKVKGPTQRVEVIADGAGVGFKEPAIKRAGGKLGVITERTRTVPPQTIWSLPPVESTSK